MDMDNTQRALINYWFRHIWELAWPLYPGFILIVALADIPIAALISRTWPAVLIMLVSGWFFFLRPGVLRVKRDKSLSSPGKRDVKAVLVQGLPLIVAIVGSVGLECLIPVFAPKVSFEIGVLAALVASIVCIMVQNRLGLEFTRQVLGKKSLYSMLLVIAAIFMFKETMYAADVVRAMSEAAGEDAALFAAAVFLPFLVGMVSGITVAFVGSTFPLLLGLIDTLGIQGQMIPYLVLASFAGFTGVLVSPLHICFILTCRFFRVDISRTWRKLVPPSLVFAVCGFLLFLFLLFVIP
jgi:hypothetical protein